MASGKDIATLSDFSDDIQKKYPSINVFLTDDRNIIEKYSLLASAKEHIRTFSGTLCVHQVSWNTEDPKNPEPENKKENPSDSEQIITPKGRKHQLDNKQQPSRSKKTFKNGDFILVKLLFKNKNRVPLRGYVYRFGRRWWDSGSFL